MTTPSSKTPYLARKETSCINHRGGTHSPCIFIYAPELWDDERNRTASGNRVESVGVSRTQRIIKFNAQAVMSPKNILFRPFLEGCGREQGLHRVLCQAEGELTRPGVSAFMLRSLVAA